jgi:hypothetical protein
VKPAVEYPDAERLTVDYLTAELDEDATVGVGVPDGWTSADDPHLEVALDGVPLLAHPVCAHATIRLVARAGSTTEAKRIATKALGVLAAHPGSDDGIHTVRPLTGPLPARDPKTEAELASVTARVTVRSAPIEPSGS